MGPIQANRLHLEQLPKHRHLQHRRLSPLLQRTPLLPPLIQVQRPRHLVTRPLLVPVLSLNKRATHET